MQSITSGMQGCSYDGKEFPQGSELCLEGRICKLCDGGEFVIPVELSTDQEDMLADPGEAYFAPGV
ncbi:MAG: hypothetical protein AAGU11_04280 [Syntrophobacteraceae bacterium]